MLFAGSTPILWRRTSCETPKYSYTQIPSCITLQKRRLLQPLLSTLQEEDVIYSSLSALPRSDRVNLLYCIIQKIWPHSALPWKYLSLSFLTETLCLHPLPHPQYDRRSPQLSDLEDWKPSARLLNTETDELPEVLYPAVFALYLNWYLIADHGSALHNGIFNRPHMSRSFLSLTLWAQFGWNLRAVGSFFTNQLYLI